MSFFPPKAYFPNEPNPIIGQSCIATFMAGPAKLPAVAAPLRAPARTWRQTKRPHRAGVRTATPSRTLVRTGHARLNDMQLSLKSKPGVVVAVVLTAALCHGAPAQDAQSKDAQTREAKGLSPRATPADYQTHAQAGAITIAAEFSGHSVTSPQSVLATEDYVVVEVAFFGPPETQLKLSGDDFSLRINGKKTTLPARPYASVFKSLKDPEWEPPIPVESKSKTSLGTGGGGG